MHNTAILEDNFTVCIARCPNLLSLALWTNQEPYCPALVENLLRVGLKYLSFDIDPFIGALAEHGQTLPIPFPTVTHLELIGEVNEVNLRQVKAYFPALTHLAITGLVSNSISVLRDALNIFGRQLKALIWYQCTPGTSRTRTDEPPRAARTSEYTAEEDPRIVILWYGWSFVNTWREGVTGGLGIWMTADEAVRARLAGAVET
ncbi:hypothetical protein BDN72DRAFT_965015 [Pluteus cervinus]|uniref:Uncharacterized protein n=1 Tax=Pluteus cervinus TaxID=181527 RepID=A0ACD3A7N4_9AGAR|nr:hypothetical protein BDN72DRAFT_965015 [Pluteus cervinus]